MQERVVVPLVCERCGYMADRPSYMKRHLSRKVPCDLLKNANEDAIRCETCYRTFQSREGYLKHVNAVCDHKPSVYGCSECKKDFKNKQALYKHKQRGCTGSEEDTDDTEALKDMVRRLKEQLDQTSRGPTTINNNTIHIDKSKTTNHNSTNNVQIVNFNLRTGSQYDTSHITPEKVRAIIDRFRPDHLPQAGSQLLQLLFSNPVNRNLAKRSLYNKVCDVYMDQEWRIVAEEDPMKVLTYDVFGVALDTYEQNDPYSKKHAEILNLIVSEEEPYESKARDAIRAAVYDWTRKHALREARIPPRSVLRDL